MVRRTGFRIQDSGFRIRRSSFALALLCLFFCSSLVTRHSSLPFAQLPAGTPVYSVNAKWVTDHGSQVFNVKAYGSVGDGTTDDTAAIQAGLNQVCGVPGMTNYGSGWLYFPAGNYKITSTLYCWSHNGHTFHISGASGGGNPGSGGTTISWFGPSGGAMLIIFSGADYVVDNLVFDCREVATYGIVVTATNVINTTLGTAVPGAGSYTVTPASMSYIVALTSQYPGTILNVDTGNNFEAVFVTATTSTTFTATFTKAHSASAVVGNSGGMSDGMFRDITVVNDGGTYSAGFLVGNPGAPVDLSNIIWQHCNVGWNTGVQTGNLYAGWLFAGYANVLDFHWQNSGVGSHKHAIDASTDVGSLELDGFTFSGNTASDLLLNSDENVTVRNSWSITDSGGTFVVGLGNYFGTLTVEHTVIQGLGIPGGVTISWQGPMRLLGDSFQNASGGDPIIVAPFPLFGSPPGGVTTSGVSIVGCKFIAATSPVYPPLYDGSGNALLPTYAGGQPVAVYAFDNYVETPSQMLRLADYSAVGILTDESQTPVATTGVLRGGDTSCLLGFRNHGATGDDTLCKNTSDQLVFNGTGISAPQLVSTVSTGTPPLSATSTTPVANLTVQNCDTCNITTSMTVGGGTALHAMNLYSTGSITPTAVSATSCSDQTFSVSGLLTTDVISNITPPGSLGNIALSAYPSAAGTLLLHFCNPSSSSVTPPAGAYSFLAVH